MKKIDHRSHATENLCARQARVRPMLEDQGDRHGAAVAFAEAPVNVQDSRPMSNAAAFPDAQPHAPGDEAASPAEAAPGDAPRARPAWLDRAVVLIPAYDAEPFLGRVVHEMRTSLPELARAILVIDDGSRDATARAARDLGCEVVSLGVNRGKGAALRTGFATARARGYEVALTVDADGQHPGDDARKVLLASDDPASLVLGIRDLVAAGAPPKNRFSNGVSNFFLSYFSGARLADTQCGLRRYPIDRTLALAARGDGYDFEGEVLLRAIWEGVPIVEEPISVRYPEDRVTHFDSVKDPMRIVRTVVAALAERRRRADRAGDP